MHTVHSRRIAALHSHLSPEEHNEISPLLIEECAATHNINFGRQQETDASFARPAKQLLSRDQRVYTSALRYGDGTLTALRGATSSAGSYSSKPFSLPGGTQNPPPALPTEFDSVKGWTPQVHTISKPHEDVFIFVLPGAKKGSLQVAVEGCKVFISGTRVKGFSMHAHPAPPEEIPIQKSSGKLSLGKPQKATGVREGDFSLTWSLPEGSLAHKLAARFSNNRLRLAVPKA